MTGLLFLFHSCQKENVDEVVPVLDNGELSSIEKRFLDPGNLKSGGDEQKADFVAQILSDMERQDKEQHFIGNFVKRYGYPDWEMTRFFTDEEQTVAQVAVSRDESCETEAVILCVKDQNKLKYRLFVRDKLDKFKENKKPIPTYNKIRDLFIIFDFQKYGESNYLPEGEIYSGTKDEVQEKSAEYYMMIETCYTIIVTNSVGELLSMRNECEYEYRWATAGGSSSGSGSGSSTGSENGDYYVNWYDEENGVGGSTSYAQENCDCHICPVCKGCLDQLIQLKSIPMPGEGETTVNCPMCSCPKIDYNGITENEKAWCVLQKLIQTGTNDYNALVLSFIASFSGNEPYRDVVFKIDNLDDAYGSFDGTVYPPVIYLNSETISNRAPIEIAKTLMHEMLHAFIYQDASLYPSSFITNFRDYLIEVEGSNNVYDKNDHQIIYENYVIPMINFLKD